ncbi:MAG: hypothetical protein VCB77_09155 [Alphaproteobacteria bacterium]
MQKILLVGGGVAAIAIIGVIAVVVSVLSWLDGLIQEDIETHGSEITKAEVTLADVNIDLTSGQGSLSGFKVGNPVGFNTPSAFQLGNISVTLDTSTLSQDPIVIKEIVINAPDITYEVGGDGSNLDALQRNVEAYMAQFDTGEPAESADDGEGPKLVIEDLYINGGTVNVSAPFLGGKSLTTPLPDIQLQDIGKEDDGASPGEIAEEIFASIKESATGAVSGLGVEGLVSGAGEMPKGVTEGAGEALEGVTEGAGEALEGVAEGPGEALEGVTEGLGILLGGSSD